MIFSNEDLKTVSYEADVYEITDLRFMNPYFAGFFFF